jgi:hypothetical protein
MPAALGVNAPWSWFSGSFGALVRDRDITVRYEDTSDDTRSVTLAARGMIGWSWPLTRHLFLAVAAGISAGLEMGQETHHPDRIVDGPDAMPIRREISRLQVDPRATSASGSYWAAESPRLRGAICSDGEPASARAIRSIQDGRFIDTR